jgi:hypothetical protein
MSATRVAPLGGAYIVKTGGGGSCTVHVNGWSVVLRPSDARTVTVCEPWPSEVTMKEPGVVHGPNEPGAPGRSSLHCAPTVAPVMVKVNVNAVSSDGFAGAFWYVIVGPERSTVQVYA